MKNKSFTYLLGVLITALGVTLVYMAGLGSAPSSTLVEGISISLEIRKGSANIFLNMIILVMVFLLNRSNIGIGTLLSSFSFGLAINFWGLILSREIDGPFIYKLVILFVGVIIEAYGLSYYMSADLGYGSLELLSDLVSRLLKKSFAVGKTITDFVFMIVGFALGGTIGIGTVVTTLMMGSMINFFIERKRRENEKN